jgi:hypothetical protein
MSEITIQEINSGIMFGTFTNDQLDSIAAAIKFRRGQITRENKRVIWPGDTVEFYAPNRGRTIQGKVVKMAIKNATIREGTTMWRVPVSMLTVPEHA